ncbi:MAG: type IV pilus secretin PilQ [Chromatiales bacterium]
MAGGAWAQSGENVLEEISYTALPGELLEVSLRFAQPPAEPMSFTIENPARIALDFPNTRSGLSKRNREVGVGVTRSINTAEARGRTRVVLNLSQLASYRTQVRGNEVVVSIGGSGADTVSAAAGGIPASAQAAAQPSPLARVTPNVSNIDFRRGSTGEARVVLTLSDPKIPVTLADRRGSIELEAVGAELSPELERRLDVVDFATPAQFVDAFESNGSTKVVVTLTGDYEQLAYQSDNIFTLEVKPLIPEEVEERRKEQFEGERLSLNFQDIEVRSVLQLIADFTGLNVVVSDSVSGNLTLRLKNVPWDQALDIILKTKGLAMRETGNVLLIAPTEEIAAREKLELEAQQQVQELAPLRTEFIQVNYARAGDLASLLQGSQASLLSDRGSVTIDPRTNTLLVQDTNQKLDQIRNLVQRLDVPVRQVLIDSRIVIARDDFSRDLGVRFGGAYTKGNDPIYAGAGTLEGANTVANGGVPSINDRLISDLGVINPAGSLALAILGDDYLIDLELSASEAEGRGEVVSSPRVITSNQIKARIEQGVEIPYQEATSSGATSVSFKKAVLSLDVTPNITPDDRVFLDLQVNQDTVGEVFFGIPSIDTREVQTQVLVDDGQTVVLGGIYETDSSEETDKVPFFGDIPLVGRLFRTDSVVDDKSELLIFVTPKIMRGSGLARVTN